MSKILAVDTSTSSLSLAIADEEGVCGEFALYTGGTHSQSLLPMADALFTLSGIKQKDLSALAVTLGPGSFTGLRIGLATVKAWAFALDLPVVGISSTYCPGNEISRVKKAPFSPLGSFLTCTRTS